MTMILDGTAGATFPTWTTGTRPATPSVGQVGWNTTIGSLENYNGSAWTAVGGGGAGQWQSVQTTGFTAVSGNAYPCDTTSAAFTVTLPSSPSAGNYIQLVDYAGTWNTNNLTLNPNGLKINGSTSNVTLNINRQAVAIAYIDATQGWICYSQGALIGPYSVDYLVVAGGGGAMTGGGGAGGLVYGTTTLTPTTAYSITIGAGGTGVGGTSTATNGGNSSINTINTAVGGGRGGTTDTAAWNGGSGGSGGGVGGDGRVGTAGTGTAGQGYAGGINVGANPYPAGAGGGASAVGGAASGSSGGAGGAGYQWLNGTYYAGGGGGGIAYTGTGGNGGSGGGGNGNGNGNGVAGTANTGGGGGGLGDFRSGLNVGGNGGSGVVIIRYLGGQRGTGGTVTTVAGYTYHTFTTSGTYSA